MIFLLIFVYAIAMTLANLSIAYFGVWVSPINAFLFIGMDLALRDVLHEKLSRAQMFGLILISGLITYVLNNDAGMIAVASALSFAIAAICDYIVFSRSKGSWFSKSNKSNVAGAAVDSLVFPTVAFGSLMPEIVAMQFAAKVAGGFVWSFVFKVIKK